MLFLVAINEYLSGHPYAYVFLFFKQKSVIKDKIRYYRSKIKVKSLCSTLTHLIKLKIMDA